ncbi:MAG: hypothetical protein EKK40_08095 [Bradyrhizobiaceae bacterium]|nr:MAG: hypothetical protein EKK40_08095 [Bradyrhizobiaceae bacterium]
MHHDSLAAEDDERIGSIHTFNAETPRSRLASRRIVVVGTAFDHAKRGIILALDHRGDFFISICH